MPLTEGTRIGPYQIVGLVGAGGMGEVYKARDTILNRDVALKVLPESLAGDAERLSRFRREARVLASLNHPNIAHIHGFEESTSTDSGQASAHALVMELVDGPTLADRIAAGPISVSETLPIARQIAEALESAHEQGIVHRDLKPANVKVRDDGTVKVLDFGIAKAVDAGVEAASTGPHSPEPPQTLTMAGAIPGTAAYMSPEQAKGKAVDRRTDIWAFGAVVFEMLTGERVFGGDSTSETLVAVLTRDVDWAKLPHDTPLRLRRLLTRCLDRDVKTRLRDIGEARIEIAAITAAPTGAVVGAFPLEAGGARVSRAVLWLSGALVIVSAGLAVSLLSPQRAPAAPVRLSVTFPERSPLQLGQSQPSLAFSPDGRTIVYTAVGPEGTQLWLRDLNAFAPQPIGGTSGGRLAFFSPDGRWIGFMANGSIKKMPVTLGPPVLVCSYAGVAMGATWTSNDEIVFATRATAKGLWKVPSAGGDPVAVADAGVWYPDALPGGRAVVVTMLNNTAEISTGDLAIAAVSLADGKITKLFDGGTYVRFSPTGHLIYLRNNALMGAPFDAATLAVGKSRAVVIDPVFMDPALVSGNFAVSAAGAVAYAPGDATDFKRTIVSVTASGVTPLINERRAYRGPRVSADGRRLAVIEQAWRDRIWIVDIDRQTFVRLASGRYASESAPVWSPDGRRVAFRVVTYDSAINIFVAPSDGSGAEQRLLSGFGEVTPESWTADGRSLLFSQHHADGRSDIMMLNVDGEPQVRPVLKTSFSESAAAISPDGRWLAYQSDRSNRSEVYVTAFPSMSPTVQVSTGGGATPVWSRDGRRWVGLGGGRFYDVTRDGQRFVVIKDVLLNENDPAAPRLIVVVHWIDEVKSRLRIK